MTRSTTESRMLPVLRALPQMVLEVAQDGRILRSNERLDALVGERVAGRALESYFPELTGATLRDLWTQAGVEGEAGIARTLRYEVAGARDTGSFKLLVVPTPEGEAALCLLELPRATAGVLGGDLTEANAELVAAQSELRKKANRLARALDEIENKLWENQQLSQELQDRSVEVDHRNSELLSITEKLHRGQEALQQLHHELERRSRELQVALSGRNRFYASMSHELRTPVNAVMGYNDLLLAGVYGDLNEQQELALERSQAAVRHLRALINDVLDISKIEAGKLEIEAEEVYLAELLEDLLATVEPMAEAQGSQMHLVLEGAPAIVNTDPRRLGQILLNLLSNAIKFGDGRPIWIRCETGELGGLRIEVVDSGAGVAAEDLGAIFDEFTQLEGSMTAGTGLGLPIARRLARLLGGDLEAESTIGAGTTFRLRLPRTPPGRVR